MKHLWIINEFSSTTLFYHSYDNIELDPNLVSGLLTAFNNFSEVELKSQGISAIEMAGLRWIYEKFGDETGLLLVAASNFDLEASVTRSRLEVIHRLFVEEFDITLERVKEGAFNVRLFEKFSDKLMDLEDQWNQAELILSSSMMYDMLGIFQQLFNRIHKLIPNVLSVAKSDKVMDLIKEMSERLKNAQVIQECPGLSEINYDPKRGWEILNVNPMMMDGDILIEALLLISTNIKRIMLDYIPANELTYHFSKYILPYILNEYTIISRLGLEKKLLEHFLILD